MEWVSWHCRLGCTGYTTTPVTHCFFRFFFLSPPYGILVVCMFSFLLDLFMYVKDRDLHKWGRLVTQSSSVYWVTPQMGAVAAARPGLNPGIPPGSPTQVLGPQIFEPSSAAFPDVPAGSHIGCGSSGTPSTAQWDHDLMHAIKLTPGVCSYNSAASQAWSSLH